MKLHQWKVLHSTRPYPHLRVDAIELPNGRTIQKLVHEYAEWATVLPITKNQEVVLVKQYRHGVQQITLEFPGGIVDDGEQPLVAAKRELLEETGYFGGNWLSIGSPSPNPDNHTNRIHTFLALDVEAPDAPLMFSEDEEIEVELRPLDEVFNMARDGRLLQAMQISALFLALPYLH